MAINSTVWQCESTGKDNLTYEEALKSERLARKKLEQFKHSLRAPVLLLIEHAQQSAMRTLFLIVSKFLRKRYFLKEEVGVANKRNTMFEVVGITLAKNHPEPSNGIYEDTDQLEYHLRSSNGDEITAPFEMLRRRRSDFSNENLTMFIKNNVTRIDGILRVKPDIYKQHIIDAQINFSSVFIGKMPRYSPAKIKDPSKKQSTLNKFIVKDEAALAKNKAVAEAKAKSLAEEMERVRQEKLAKILEQERLKAQKKAELMQRVEDECTLRMTKTDDLERTDQRMLPRYRSVTSLLPDKLLGDAFMLREFMHSYQGLLSGMQAFRQNLNYYEMIRAFSAREVNGPLSDILLVLLGTIFDLQKEEEESGELKYIVGYRTQRQEPYITMSNAARTHIYVKRHLSFELFEMPLDATTVSEVLRLHLLGSGAQVSDRTEKWRFSYRNGYVAREDPGLDLRMQHANILHALKTMPISKLDFEDIMLVIKCLMAQILTYSSTLSIIEERMEKMAKARMEMRNLVFAENRRLAAVKQSQRNIAKELLQEAGNKPPTEEQNEEMNRRLAELMAQSKRDQRKHEQQMLKAQSELFNFMVYLGVDRCYRKYYVLESIPGIFIEHAPDANMDTCLTEPPVNRSPAEISKEVQLATHREWRSYLLKLYTDVEDGKGSQRKNGIKQSLDNKENKENQVNGQMNGHAEPVEPMEEEVTEVAEAASAPTRISRRSRVGAEQPPPPAADVEEEPVPVLPTATDLYMCSGEPGNCIVHDEQHPKRHLWQYICDPDVIDALISSLNPLGHRESQLLEALTQQRALIDKHIRNCPEEMLNLSDETKRRKFVSAMQQDTQRKYGRTTNEDVNETLRQQLVDRILKFEMDIYEGDLGKLKVKDMEKWRQNLIDDKYDPQCKIQWGPGKMETEDEGDSDNESHENYDEQEQPENPMPRIRYGKYQDPSEFLHMDDVKDDKSLIDPEHQAHIHNLACALLQVEQAIEQRFLNEPFGVNRKPPNQQLHSQPPESKLPQWELSLMKSTSYSQIFLHLNVLNDSILWRRSTNNSICKICRRRTDAEQLLLCDHCNGGTHMFCLRPKMIEVPEGNWYCGTCVKELGFTNTNQNTRETRARKRQMYEKEDDEGVEEDNEDENDDEDAEEDNDDDDDENENDDGDEEEENSEAESNDQSDVPNSDRSVRLKIKNTRSSSRRNSRPLKVEQIKKILEEEESEDDEDETEDVDVNGDAEEREK